MNCANTNNEGGGLLILHLMKSLAKELDKITIQTADYDDSKSATLGPGKLQLSAQQSSPSGTDAGSRISCGLPGQLSQRLGPASPRQCSYISCWLLIDLTSNFGQPPVSRRHARALRLKATRTFPAGKMTPRPAQPCGRPWPRRSDLAAPKISNPPPDPIV